MKKKHNLIILTIIGVISVLLVLIQGGRIMLDVNKEVYNYNITIKSPDEFSSMNSYKFYLVTLQEPILFASGDNYKQLQYRHLENFEEHKYVKDLEEKFNFQFEVFPQNFLLELDMLQFTYGLYYDDPEYFERVLIKQQKKTIYAFIEDSIKYINNIYEKEQIQYYNEFNIKFTSDTIEKQFRQNIDEAYKLLDDIQSREKILYGQEYNNIPIPYKPNLNDFQRYDKSNIISPEQAQKLFTIYVFESPHQEKKLEWSTKLDAERFKVYWINSECIGEENVPVYGINENIYTNIFVGRYWDDKKWDLFDNYRIDYDFDSEFTSCKCPYSERSRIEWYLIDYFVNKIQDKKKVNEYEQKFINNPSTYNLKLLGEYYKYSFWEEEQNVELWGDYNKIQSKGLFLMKDAYEDIDMKTHFEQYSGDIHSGRAESIFIVDSFYDLLFPVWSFSDLKPIREEGDLIVEEHLKEIYDPDKLLIDKYEEVIISIK